MPTVLLTKCCVCLKCVVSSFVFYIYILILQHEYKFKGLPLLAMFLLCGLIKYYINLAGSQGATKMKVT